MLISEFILFIMFSNQNLFFIYPPSLYIGSYHSDINRYEGETFIIGKPPGRRPLGRPSCRWEDDIRMDFKEIGVDTRIGSIRLIGIVGGSL